MRQVGHKPGPNLWMNQTAEATRERREGIVPGQASYHRTRVLKFIDLAVELTKVAEEQAATAAPGKTRPLLPAGFRRKVSALVIEVDKRVASIRAEEVQ